MKQSRSLCKVRLRVPASPRPCGLLHSVAPGQLAAGFLRISPCLRLFTRSHTDWFYVAFMYTTHIFPLKVKKKSLSRNKITELMMTAHGVFFYTIRQIFKPPQPGQEHCWPWEGSCEMLVLFLPGVTFFTYLILSAAPLLNCLPS